MREKNSGFTLIEMALVVGFTVIMGVVIIVSLSSRKSRVELDNTTKQIVTLLREAQSRAAAGEQNAVWGVHFENSTTTVPFYALFYGSYASSTTKGYWRLPVSLRFATSSVPEGSSTNVVFSQVSGLPTAQTSIGLELTGGGAGGGASVGRATSGKIFFDDFNRSSL